MNPTGRCHKWTHNRAFVTQRILSAVGPAATAVGPAAAAAARPLRSVRGAVLSEHAQGRVRCYFPFRNRQSISEA